MEKIELTCINCPLGCEMTVQVDENKNAVKIEGNSCKMGEIYARTEVKDPRRMVTSTARIEGSNYPTVPCKTETSIPKDKIMECMEEINKIDAKAPSHVGDVLLENVCGTGINIVATAERVRV